MRLRLQLIPAANLPLVSFVVDLPDAWVEFDGQQTTCQRSRIVTYQFERERSLERNLLSGYDGPNRSGPNDIIQIKAKSEKNV